MAKSEYRAYTITTGSGGEMRLAELTIEEIIDYYQQVYGDAHPTDDRVIWEGRRALALLRPRSDGGTGFAVTRLDDP